MKSAPLTRRSATLTSSFNPAYPKPKPRPNSKSWLTLTRYSPTQKNAPCTTRIALKSSSPISPTRAVPTRSFLTQPSLTSSPSSPTPYSLGIRTPAADSTRCIRISLIRSANELNFARRLGLGSDSVREAPVMGNLDSPYENLLSLSIARLLLPQSHLFFFFSFLSFIHTCGCYL